MRSFRRSAASRPTAANRAVPVSPSAPTGETFTGSPAGRLNAYIPDIASAIGAKAGQWPYGEGTVLPKPETDTYTTPGCDGLDRRMVEAELAPCPRLEVLGHDVEVGDEVEEQLPAVRVARSRPIDCLAELLRR